MGKPRQERKRESEREKKGELQNTHHQIYSNATFHCYIILGLISVHKAHNIIIANVYVRDSVYI